MKYLVFIRGVFIYSYGVCSKEGWYDLTFKRAIISPFVIFEARLCNTGKHLIMFVSIYLLAFCAEKILEIWNREF